MEITKDDLEYLKTTIGWIIDNAIVNTDNRAYHETFHNSTLNSMEIVERALEKPDTSASGLHKHIVSVPKGTVCPICNVTELVNGNCKTCTDELCKPFKQTAR